MTNRTWKYGKDSVAAFHIPQTKFRLILALVLATALLGLTTGVVRADIDLLVRVIDCITRKPIPGAMVSVATARKDLGSATQSGTGTDGIANIKPLRDGDVNHTIVAAAPGYQYANATVYMNAWTTQYVEICLLPEGVTGSRCDPAAIAAAEKRVANLVAKLDQAKKETGSAIGRWYDAREDYIAARGSATYARTRARKSADRAEHAKKRAETVIQLAKDKPGSRDIYHEIEFAVASAEYTHAYTLEAVNEGFGSLQEVILLHRQITALDLYATPRDFVEAPNPYTDAEYIQAAEEIIKVVERLAEIAEQMAVDLRVKQQAEYVKVADAIAAYQKAKAAETAIKSELAQATAELNALLDACNK